MKFSIFESSFCFSLFIGATALAISSFPILSFAAGTDEDVETLVKHSEIMCVRYASEAARDVAKAVKAAAGDAPFGIYVRNKYTLCPMSRLSETVRTAWYSKYGAIGYDRNATPAEVALAVAPLIKDYGKTKQGPEGNKSYDSKGKEITRSTVIPMFEPQCLKVFRECF
jgi:hypothetical protein